MMGERGGVRVRSWWQGSRHRRRRIWAGALSYQLVIDHTGIPAEWIEHIARATPQDPIVKFFAT
jgi:hypothetical protein